MKTVWVASLAMLAMPAAVAQTTIYKHVDESGRVTYSNKPMKGAALIDLEPLNTIPATPGGLLQVPGAQPAAELQKTAAIDAKAEAKRATANSDVRPASLAVVLPLPKERLASVEPQVQKRRDDDRRKILERELAREEESLSTVRTSLTTEQQNPVLIAAVRVAQQAADPTPSQLAEFRSNIDKASGRIRGLQATAVDHEKNIDALKKELGALKP